MPVPDDRGAKESLYAKRRGAQRACCVPIQHIRFWAPERAIHMLQPEDYCVHTLHNHALVKCMWIATIRFVPIHVPTLAHDLDRMLLFVLCVNSGGGGSGAALLARLSDVSNTLGAAHRGIRQFLKRDRRRRVACGRQQRVAGYKLGEDINRLREEKKRQSPKVLDKAPRKKQKLNKAPTEAC